MNISFNRGIQKIILVTVWEQSVSQSELKWVKSRSCSFFPAVDSLNPLWQRIVVCFSLS